MKSHRRTFLKQATLGAASLGLFNPWRGGLAASNQFGLPNQTDVFVVALDGATKVSWAVGGGAWGGPLSI